MSKVVFIADKKFNVSVRFAILSLIRYGKFGGDICLVTDNKTNDEFANDFNVKIVQVERVNPRGTSKEYKYGSDLDRDYNASLNILERGMLGQGLPFEPLEIEPLRELMQVSASSIVERGSPLR